MNTATRGFIKGSITLVVKEKKIFIHLAPDSVNFKDKR